jgi:hypothetical protein
MVSIHLSSDSFFFCTVTLTLLSWSSALLWWWQYNSNAHITIKSVPQTKFRKSEIFSKLTAVVSLTVALDSFVILDNFRGFENGALRAIFGGKLVTCGCRKSYHGKFHNVYSSPVIIKTIKLGRTRWAQHVVPTSLKCIFIHWSHHTHTHTHNYKQLTHTKADPIKYCQLSD